MRVRSAELLVRYLTAADISQARLARYAMVSRQFVNQLVKGQVTGCTAPVARRIETRLGVLPGTLFVPSESPSDGEKVA